MRSVCLDDCSVGEIGWVLGGWGVEELDIEVLAMAMIGGNL